MGANSLLMETIRIQNGRVRNIKYHNRRCNDSRRVHYASKNNIDLRKIIDTTKAKSKEVKCRITFDDKVRKVEYEPYSICPIQSLAYVEVGNFEYSFKYSDRRQLKEFFDQRGDNDDILMTKNGFVTDTYYANIALLKDNQWYTPKHPILKGCRRAQLLDKGKIVEAKIHIDQVKEYEAIAIFNSMIPFKRIKIKI